jgi:hypothetical protein
MQSSCTAIDNIYIDVDKLIPGDGNSRDCNEAGIIHMVSLIQDNGYDRTSRFLAYPHEGAELFDCRILSVEVFKLVQYFFR